MRPINQRKNESDRIQYLANYDELTGHFNKTRLRESLDQSLYYSTRYKVVGALLVVGIDNINVVNQAFGYEVADAVIVAVGHRLDQCLRSCDVIGRVGGDRFGVVLSNCPSDELPAADPAISTRPVCANRWISRYTIAPGTRWSVRCWLWESTISMSSTRRSVMRSRTRSSWRWDTALINVFGPAM